MIMTDVKEFLYGWSGRRKIIPNYDVKAIGTKHKQRFLCTCQLRGYDFVGVGNSTSKRDAMSNAALDIIQFLLRTNVLEASQVPAFSQPTEKNPEQGTSSSSSQSETKAVTKATKAATQAAANAVENTTETVPEAADDYNKQVLQRAEEADFTADLHGGWTFENAKSRLHQFLQTNKIKGDYKFTSTGPSHNKCFVAEMSIYVNQARTVITAREQGNNKQTSSKFCALSLIRQLFHMKLVEPFTAAKKYKKFELPPYRVDLNASTLHELTNLLQCYRIEPRQFNPNLCSKENSISLLCKADDYLLDSSLGAFFPNGWSHDGGRTYHHQGKASIDGVVCWSPPSPDWNPWVNCPVDGVSMATINSTLFKSFEDKINLKAYHKNMEDQKNLPIFRMKDRIIQVINSSPVCLIRGETGSGKTTQVPQYILNHFIQNAMGGHCNIIVTQPRRISAVSTSERVADERCEGLGQSTGYNVRFESVLPRSHGSILYCTVGTMLRKLEVGLRGISHIIVDEIHERDIQTDFLLIILRDMISIYPNFRVILMSATVDTEAFTRYFGASCPVVEVSGRVHQVKEYFLEDIVEMLNFVPTPYDKRNKEEDDECFQGDKDDKEENCNLHVSSDYSENTRNTLAQMNERELCFELIEVLIGHISTLKIDGAILIFLSGWNVIFSLYKHLLRNPFLGSSKFLILPLHSQIPRDDQRKVFYPPPRGVTKVILSTNIAESSITINDVVFVIDFCKIKTKLFTFHNNMTNYTTMWCSKTNLEQRKGRAGRVRPGYCYYLCSRERYRRLDEYSTPEILRSPLHEFCLTIKLLGLGGIGWFFSKAIQPPPIDAVIEAEALLREMKALDKKSQLTYLGRILARMPVEPRLGKMIIYACIFGCADAACTMAASSAFSEPFVVSMERKRLEWIHKSMSGDRHSDHCAMLNAFQSWSEAKASGEHQEIRFCESQYLNAQILRMTNEAKVQMTNILKNTGFPDNCFNQVKYHFRGEDSSLDTLLTLLGLGLYPNVCFHKDKRKLITSDSRPALVHKTSVNCSNTEINFPFPFFIFTEKLRTKAVACKQMSMVTPIQLLLFGSRAVRFDGELVVLDNWINLQMDPTVAAKIVALRPALENLVTKATADPDIVSRLDDLDLRLIRLVGRLSSARVASYGFESSDGEPPLKRLRLDRDQMNYNACLDSEISLGHISTTPGQSSFQGQDVLTSLQPKIYSSNHGNMQLNLNMDMNSNMNSQNNETEELPVVTESSDPGCCDVEAPGKQTIPNIKDEMNNDLDFEISSEQCYSAGTPPLVVKESLSPMIDQTSQLAPPLLSQNALSGQECLSLIDPTCPSLVQSLAPNQTDVQSTLIVKSETTPTKIKEEGAVQYGGPITLLNFRMRSMAPNPTNQNSQYMNPGHMRPRLRMPGPDQNQNPLFPNHWTRGPEAPR